MTANDELRGFATAKELSDSLSIEEMSVNKNYVDSKKKIYILYRGLDAFPKSSIICIQLADALCEMPDQSSWDQAER